MVSNGGQLNFLKLLNCCIQQVHQIVLSSLTFALVATTEAEDEVESALLLDVVVSKGATVLELLPGEDETLLIGRNALLVLDLLLDVVDGVARLNLEGDSLASKSLHENLHLVWLGVGYYFILK